MFGYPNFYMLTRKVEDYLETMYNLLNKKGEIRTKDLAKDLGIKPPSVTEMLKKLSKEGLVKYEKYSGTRLTEYGLKEAKRIRKRHDIFEEFLKAIYVPKEVAERDACTLEHHLEPETVDKLSLFVKYLKGERSKKFLKEFEKFCRD